MFMMCIKRLNFYAHTPRFKDDVKKLGFYYFDECFKDWLAGEKRAPIDCSSCTEHHFSEFLIFFYSFLTLDKSPQVWA